MAKRKISAQIQYNEGFFFGGDLEQFKKINGLMTGEEFRDRFSKELDKVIPDIPNWDLSDMKTALRQFAKVIDESLKKAAGIK